MRRKSSAQWDTFRRPYAPAASVRSSMSSWARGALYRRAQRAANRSKNRKRSTSSATKKESPASGAGKTCRRSTTQQEQRSPAKGPGRGYDEHDRADYGHGHPGRNFPAGFARQVVSEERPELRPQAVKPSTNLPPGLKGPGTK